MTEGFDPAKLWAYRWARERKRCEEDFPYLASNYLRIKSKEIIGFPTLRFNPVQQIIHAKVEDQLRRTGFVRLVIGKPRQVGSSTYFQARGIHQTAFKSNRNALIVAHDEPTAIELFSITKGYYDALPAELRPRTRYDAKQRIIFEGRNSKIMSAHAANTNVAAGQMLHIVHLTEAARYGDRADLVQASLFPTLSEARGADHSMCVVESTSVIGGEWFKEFGEAAQRGDTEYEFLFIPAFKHHVYVAHVPEDVEWTHEERELYRRFHADGLTHGFLMWRRQQIQKFRSNPLLVQQEYPNCLVADTRVSTEGGLVPITEAGHWQETEALPIVSVVDNGVAETFEMQTRLGYRVTGTRTHMVEKADGRLAPLASLSGERVRLVPPRFAAQQHTAVWQPMPLVESRIAITPEVGRWLGYFVGDGSWAPERGANAGLVGAYGQVSFCCDARDADVVDDVDRLCRVLLDVSPSRRLVGPNKGGCELRGSVRADVLIALGVLSRQGSERRWKRKVCVPDVIWRSPQGVVREFLRGLFECDGHARPRHNEVVLCAKGADFLADVQLLLLGFGITARHHKQRDGTWWLSLRSEEGKVFKERVGFVGARKLSAVAALAKKSGRRRRPIVLDDAVMAIVSRGLQRVYDLVLAKEPHTFSANGISVHNSWEESWVLPKGAMRVFDDTSLDNATRGIKPPTARAMPTSTGLEPQLGGPVEVWQPPQPDTFYDIGIDISEGRTEGADWTVACVVRRDTLEQVAQLRLHINPSSQDFIDMIYWLGMNYHAAQLNPDITGGWGNALLTELQMRSYPNIWRWRRRDDVKQRVSSRLGFLFTRRDKSVLVSNAVALAARGDITIHSEVLYDEMTTFLNIGLDEWSAAPGCHDDTVVAWMLALLGAYDDRLGSAPTGGQELAPVRETKRPWAFHDVDADLTGERDQPLVNMEPWEG